jgi:hypothetical protein
VAGALQETSTSAIKPSDVLLPVNLPLTGQELVVTRQNGVVSNVPVSQVLGSGALAGDEGQMKGNMQHVHDDAFLLTIGSAGFPGVPRGIP